MSRDGAASFVPAPLTAGTRAGAHAAQSAGFAAGWAAGAREAAARALAEREAERAALAAREASRDRELARAVSTLGQEIERWRAREAPAVTQVQGLVAQAAIELAEAVLGHALAPGPDAARTLVGRALAVPPGVQAVVLRVSASDHPHLEQALAATPGLLPTGVTVEVDPDFSAGDYVTVHSAGSVDGRVGEALARARAALRGQP
ncbi:FliH/SctL family protein [Demequina sp.]|uniref:FliH/SctL family protein n=1 Tax=Demequina sp. TaxID=2050685 RepID=UPI003A86B90B